MIPNPAPCELPTLPAAFDPGAQPMVGGKWALLDDAGHQVLEQTMPDSIVIERGRWEDVLVYTGELQDWIAAARACLRRSSPP